MSHTWRDSAKPLIAKALQESKGKSEPEVRRALRDAYPWGERRMHPYKIWRDEIKVQRGLKKKNNSYSQRIKPIYSMAKDPAFLFYSSDFLTGTMFMSNEQVGIYIRLLCAQHQHNGFIDKHSFNSLVGTDSFLKSKFKESENGFFNERLSEEISKRKEKSIKMSANAMQRHNKSNQKTNNNDAIALPIENENESVNEDVIKNDFKKVLTETGFINQALTEWEKWGAKIVSQEDQYWEQMKGRKISAEEMDSFLSVASRNEWAMETQQQFRITLRGFKLTNSQKVIKNTNSAAIIPQNQKFTNKW